MPILPTKTGVLTKTEVKTTVAISAVTTLASIAVMGTMSVSAFFGGYYATDSYLSSKPYKNENLIIFPDPKDSIKKTKKKIYPVNKKSLDLFDFPKFDEQVNP